MQPRFLLCLSWLALLALAGCQTRPKAAAALPHPAATTYVIVHGAWGGGWDWKPVAQMLTADGHEVYRATLTGQGERSHLASTNVDLNTHIQDVVNLILWENLHEVVLVGHSYGGMVITGVADRIPDRIKRLVYIDALLPQNGDSVNSLSASRPPHLVRDGWVPPVWVVGNPPPPHDVPMSASSFSQSIVLTNQPVFRRIPTIYILTVDPGKTPAQDDFYPNYLRAQSYGWTVEIMTGDHNVQRSHTAEVVRRLEQTP